MNLKKRKSLNIRVQQLKADAIPRVKAVVHMRQTKKEIVWMRVVMTKR